MITYNEYRRSKIAELVAEYDCKPSEAALCVNPNRWHDEVIDPAMQRGEMPSRAVVKSLVKHSPWGIGQLQKQFWSMHGQEFLPPYTDTKGMAIR
jgi:hypothetical protein